MIRPAAGDRANSFGERLREARVRGRRQGGRRITQASLAEAVGVERNTVSRWENGSMLPKDPAIIMALSRHLNVSADWLLGDLVDTLPGDGVDTVGTARELPGHEYGRAGGGAESLPPGAADLVLRYIERLASAGCTGEQQREAERFLVLGARNTLHRKALGQRTQDEIRDDVDDAWDFVTRILRRDGIRA